MLPDPLVRAKLREARHGLGSALRESTFKTFFLSLAYPAVAAVAFGISYMGLGNLAAFPGIGSLLAARVVGLLLFGAFAMLIVSTLVVGLGLLYGSSESEFLLSLPIRPHDAYRIKALESVTLSSWAFVLLGMPFAVAMAVAFGYGVAYVLAFALVSGALAWVSGNAGLALALLFGRWLVRGKTWGIGLLGVAAMIVAGVAVRAPENVARGPSTLAVLRQLLARTAWTRWEVFPSRWAAAGLEELLGRSWVGAVQWFGLLALLSAVLWRLNMHLASAAYPSAWSAAQEGSSRRASRSLASRLLTRALAPLHAHRGALLRKDLLLWGRNPVFWGQTALFFGLLGLYFLNLRTLRYDELTLFWRTLVCVLNVSAVSLVTGALTTRFLYPSISMEGPRFWILGLAPIRRSSILRHKFLLGLVWFGPMALGLGLLSSLMLRLPPFYVGWSLGIIVLVVPTLCALAAGLGAAFPSQQAESTEKAVSGFGGTLTLAMSLLYLLSVVVLGMVSLRARALARTPWTFYALIALGLSVIAGFLAMRAGRRRLERSEF